MIAPTRSTPHQVVSAIIPHLSTESPRFLVGRRSPHKVSAPGYGCPVYGRIEPGEAYRRNGKHTELRWSTAAEIVALEPVFAEDAEVFRNLTL